MKAGPFYPNLSLWILEEYINNESQYGHERGQESRDIAYAANSRVK